MADSELLNAEEYRRLCDYLYRHTGMAFTEARRYFVERRVEERMIATASSSFASYFARLRANMEGELETLINASTVNETYFYREDHQFTCLTSNLLPERLRVKPLGETLRILVPPVFDRRGALFHRHLAAGKLARGGRTRSRNCRFRH